MYKLSERERDEFPFRKFVAWLQTMKSIIFPPATRARLQSCDCQLWGREGGNIFSVAFSYCGIFFGGGLYMVGYSFVYVAGGVNVS